MIRLKIKPDQTITLNNKGFAFYTLGKNIEAIECFDQALRMEPKSADAFYGKGLVFHTMEEYKEAIECFDKALRIEPNNTKAESQTIGVKRIRKK